jgi:hypothetical protein
VALAAERYSASRGKRLFASYVVTAAASVTVELRANGKRGARGAQRASTQARPGRNVLALSVPRSTRPGRYTLLLTATANGQRSNDRATVTVRK